MSSLADNASAVARAQPKPRRKRCSGRGRAVPLDRNAKARIMVLARALMHRTEEGKHYGVLTAKFVAVLGALLWGFHNAAERPLLPVLRADRGEGGLRPQRRSTRRSARLEDAGILTWVNRIARIREWGPDLFGRAQNRWRVIRTSQRLHVRRSATARATAEFLLSPNFRLEPKAKSFIFLGAAAARRARIRSIKHSSGGAKQ